jgi:hypothetical protein
VCVVANGILLARNSTVAGKKCAGETGFEEKHELLQRIRFLEMDSQV